MIRSTACIFCLLIFVLSGCGGHKSKPEPPMENAARGIYFDSYATKFVTAIILPDGRFYAPSRKLASSGASVLSGIAVGQGTASGNTFTGEYRYSGDLNLQSGTMNATFVPGTSFHGTLSESANSLSVDGIAFSSDEYNIDTLPSMTAISGSWLTDMQGRCGPRVTIAAHGTIKGEDATTGSCTCNFSGTFSPDPAKNFYNVELTFPADSCSLPNATASGIAVLYKHRFPSSTMIDEFMMVVTSDGTATVISGIRDPSRLGPIP